MRRALALLGALVAIAATVVLTQDRRNDATGRVDVVFDTAKGVVPGQLVKIAGARAGRVVGVSLTPENQARMQLRVDEAFLPFRPDATCRILPEGPISENYVECDPGRRVGRGLPAPDGTPTVPVEQTTAPVAIQDLLNVFSAPTTTRLQLLLNELGIATSGRGGDIDDLLRRSNPSLTQATRLLEAVNGQRASLRRAITQTDEVLDGLAGDRVAVERFVRNAATTTEATAGKRVQLEQTIARLPAMLRATRDGLRSLDRTTTAARPLLGDLQAAAPPLQRVTASLPAFARQGTPAVGALSAALADGRRAIRPTRRIAESARRLGAVEPIMRNLSDFLSSTRDRGGLENVLNLAYALSNMVSLYNGVSHVVTLYGAAAPQCLAPTPTPAPGCDSTYKAGGVPINDPDNGVATRRLLRDALAALGPDDPDRTRRSSRGRAAADQPKRASPATPMTAGPSAAPGTPKAPVTQLPEVLRKPLDSVTKAPADPPSITQAEDLLDFLLGPS